MPRQIIAIGDIQGCYDEFKRLLKKLSFNPKQHKLWIAGDLVNRGPKSLQTLSFIKQLQEAGNANIVLGNHDLHLIAAANGFRDLYPSDTVAEILENKYAKDLINWLSRQPLAQYDIATNSLMVHAGIYPRWSIANALQYSAEIQNMLTSKNCDLLLENMYGNTPKKWSKTLTGPERWRCIINIFTRMRYIDKNSLALDFKDKRPVGKQAANLVPWFNLKRKKRHATNIIFGHWAALKGSRKQQEKYNVYHIDTGCVWGKQLTAYNLSTQKFIQVQSRFSAKI